MQILHSFCFGELELQLPERQHREAIPLGLMLRRQRLAHGKRADDRTIKLAVAHQLSPVVAGTKARRPII
jgi:hypothetical protein